MAIDLETVGSEIARAVLEASQRDEFPLSRSVTHVHTNLGSDVGWETHTRGLLVDLTADMVGNRDLDDLLSLASSAVLWLMQSKESRIRDAALRKGQGLSYNIANAVFPVVNKGDVSRVRYMENWGLNVAQCSTDLLPEGVVMRWKISERGEAVYVTEPRDEVVYNPSDSFNFLDKLPKKIVVVE